MLLRTIGKFVHGVVRIEISGLVPEKLINLCMAHGIFLWAIIKRHDKMLVSMYVHNFFEIRPLVRKSQCRVRVVSCSGMPFLWRRLQKRKMLWAGMAAFFFLLNYLSSYIWFVEVTGVKTMPKEKLLAIAQEHGLQIGMPKDRLQNKLIEKHLLLELPELAWVGISSQGTRVVIEVVEKTAPLPTDKAPAHIVAVKDGIIVETIALAGEPVVTRGVTVKKGDILIKGFLSEPAAINQGNSVLQQTASEPIRAKGIVKARVWYEGYGESLLEETMWERTGRYVSTVNMKFGSWEILLSKPRSQVFEKYETESQQKRLPFWRNTSLAVESTINTYHELQAKIIMRGEDDARELAKERALATVKQKIPQTAQILANDIVVIKSAESNVVRVKAHVETIEDIGEPQPINL